ncbi:MAG: hypothetical protein MUC36_27190 [Planctomycetes bacterium]|jgi:hypothetical protein|nr:hypothetical protein [Planctomycetota bacterium]
MMPRIILSAAALLVSLPAQVQGGRNPDHPLPPTNSALVSTPPLSIGTRSVGAAPTSSVLPRQPQTMAQQRRSDRPADAVTASYNSQVLFQSATDGALWAIGNDWKASFDGTGWTYVPFFGANAPRNFPLRLELAGARVGGEPLALPPGTPNQHGFAVRTERGALVEVVDLGMREVEQSFVFRSLPNRGAVTVEVRFTSELVGQAIEGGLRFASEFGAVDYTKAVAVDAVGRSLSLPIQWDGGIARIEIPAPFVAEAELPLVLDPLITTNTGVASGAPVGQVQTDPDVATIQSAGGRSLVVWRRQWSATDQDCWGRILDLNAQTIGPAFTIDFTSLDWLAPAVAGSFNGQNFLVASEVRTGTLHYIAGCLVTAAGVAGAQFDIERDGVVGLAGNNFRPDVGADPFPGAAAYYCVVFEKNVGAGNNDIYYKLVQQDGTLLTTNPTALDTGTNNQSNPTIGKSNGTGLWFIAWQSTFQFSPFDQELYGAYVNWPGTITVPLFPIATSVDEESAPATTGPLLVDGQQLRAIAFERASTLGQQREIWIRLYDTSGFQVGPDYNLSQAEGATSASYDQQAPDIDTDGVRMVVGYTEPYLGLGDTETMVSTVAYLSGGTFRLDEGRVGLGLSINNEFNTRICAESSGGSTPSPNYLVVGSNSGPNNIEAYQYGGYQQGSFFSVFGTACGTSGLTMTASGSSVLGQTATFTVNTVLPAGTIFGDPGVQSLAPLCNCILGVANPVVVGNPLSITIPTNQGLVGQFFSVQGFGFSGSNCLGLFDLTDTIDMAIR